jgi:hypothetical protein
MSQHQKPDGNQSYFTERISSSAETWTVDLLINSPTLIEQDQQLRYKAP